MSIEAIIARYGLVAIFVGAGFEGETAVVTGGVLAHQGLVPLWGAMAAAVAGSFVADQLFFAGGRRFRDAGPIRCIRERPGFAKVLALGIEDAIARGFGVIRPIMAATMRLLAAMALVGRADIQGECGVAVGTGAPPRTSSGCSRCCGGATSREPTGPTWSAARSRTC